MVVGTRARVKPDGPGLWKLETNPNRGPVIASAPFSHEREPKLWPMLFQVLFYSRYLVGVNRTKSPILIDIDQACVLKTQDHIWMMIAIHIHETQRDRDQIAA